MKYWDRAWNPVQGCKKCSEGCDNCYSETLLKKKGINAEFSEVRINTSQLKKSFDCENELIFVCSQSDLFQKEVSDYTIDGVLRKCGSCVSKRFLILTKRAERLFEYFSCDGLVNRLRGEHSKFHFDNIVFGVTVESEKYIHRLELLTKTPLIEHRFVAFEPLLSPVNIEGKLSNIDWVIAGCESGEEARYCNPEWITEIIERSDKQGVPIFINNVNWNGEVISEFNELPNVFHRDENPFAF